jgi:hypothetical protein
MFTFPGVIGSVSFPPSPYPALLYSNTGTQDNLGLFHFLGSNYGTGTWSNPQTSGSLFIFTNGTPNAGVVDNLVDRDVSTITQCTAATSASAFFAFELPVYFILTGYLLRNRTTGTAYIRNWAIQGSTLTHANTVSWTTIQSYTNNFTFTTLNQYAYFPISSTNKYLTYRILLTGFNSAGTNIISLSEVELYGYAYNTL